MLADTLVTVVNYVLGAAYAAWIVAAVLLTRRARRRPAPGGDVWRKRMWWAGLATGVLCLACGMVAWWTNLPAGPFGLLAWPGIVYLLTAWLAARPPLSEGRRRGRRVES